MRQRECELVGKRRRDSANAVGKLGKISRGKDAIFQQIEQKSIYFGSHRLHCVECERIAVPSSASRRVRS